jgi:uncharacterized protein
MEMSGEQPFELAQTSVWQALNDAQVLKSCIQGCEILESDGDGMYRIVMLAAVGPVKTRFTGRLLLSDVDPPTAYTLNFEGSGEQRDLPRERPR